MTNNKNKKIHFIHHFEKSISPANVGDWLASPYYYFRSFFSNYNCVLHSIWAILWHEIERDDIVIYGGGGLIDNSNELNEILNKIFKNCNNVIIWGAGTHKYNEKNSFGRTPITINIDLNQALYCGVRDYKHPCDKEFIPCASCLHPAFDIDQSQFKIERKIGVIKSGLEKSFAISNLPSFISNSEPIGNIIRYITTSEIMLVSSYHGAFWSMLLGRKVIIPSSRLEIDKYKFFRYPIGILSENEFNYEKIISIAEEIPEPIKFLAEARQLNYDFFKKIRNFIEEKIPKTEEPETVKILSQRVAQLEFTLTEVWNELRRLK